MSKVITKLKLHNFRRFLEFGVDFNDEMNLLIGDNESGKSSILQALDLVMSGSRSKVEAVPPASSSGANRWFPKRPQRPHAGIPDFH